MKFDKPLGETLTEYQEVEREAYKIDPTTKKVVKETIIEKVPQKVIYTKARKQRFSCRDGRHQWEMIDKHKHLAKCANCPKHRYLRAVYETIKDGHIVDREAGRIID